MFESILSLFQTEVPVTPLPEADVPHALGALLVRAAKVDQVYLFEEIEHIDELLAHRYDLNPVEAAKLRAECERLELAMPDTAALAAVLHDAISAQEREATVLALWEVVFADGVEVAAEDALLHQLEALLGVTPDRSKELHDLAMNASLAPKA